MGSGFAKQQKNVDFELAACANETTDSCKPSSMGTLRNEPGNERAVVGWPRTCAHSSTRITRKGEWGGAPPCFDGNKEPDKSVITLYLKQSDVTTYMRN